MAKKENKDKDEARRTEKHRTDEQERLDILARAGNVKGEQLFVSPSGDVERENELRHFALGNIEDPDKKFDIYYKGINRLLRAHLPKGIQNKSARDFIYEEKNTYLTRGKRKNKAGVRGADGRMGYISDADEMLIVIMDWIMQNGTMVDLFNKLRELNISKGYGTRIF